MKHLKIKICKILNFFCVNVELDISRQLSFWEQDVEENICTN
jgi:hypothetical protein